MIPRYTNPEMGRIWTDQHRYETWLLVETAAAEAMAEVGMIPAEAARDIRERGAVDIARVEEIEATTQHDIIAFTTAVAERCNAVSHEEAPQIRGGSPRVRRSRSAVRQPHIMQTTPFLPVEHILRC